MQVVALTKETEKNSNINKIRGQEGKYLNTDYSHTIEKIKASIEF